MITLLAAAPLSACNAYLHDPALEASTAAAVKTVGEIDISSDVTATLTGAYQLATKQEAAVVSFWISQRNREIINLVQPDPLERRYFSTLRKYSKSGASYVRDETSLRADIKRAIDCRLDALLVKASIFAGCLPVEAGGALPTDRSEADYVTIRNTSFVELQQTESEIEAARQALASSRDNLEQQIKVNPASPWAISFDFACEAAGKHDATAILNDPKAAKDPVTPAVIQYGAMCTHLTTTVAGAKSKLQAASESMLHKTRSDIDALMKQALERDTLAFELQRQLGEIKKAGSVTPSTPALESAVSRFQDLLKKADGAAKLVGLTELQGLLDELARIQLEKADQTASDTTPTDDVGLAERGAALLRLANATTIAVDAYRTASPADKAQSLVIAAIAVQQQIAVVAIEDELDQTKIRLKTGLERLYVGEAHALAEAGISLQQHDLRTTTAHDALIHLAAAWDSYRIPSTVLPYRELEAERKAGIQISAVNARDTQKVVAAAMAAVETYAKGGITAAEIADILSKFFIGSAILI